MNRDRETLRGVIDGADQFMSGFGVGAPRTYSREIPTWARNKSEIKKMLLSAFPELATNSKQRRAAARWAQIIQLYHVLGYTHRQVAEEMSITEKQVSNYLQSISYVYKGLTVHGDQRKKAGRGRPKINR